MTHNPPSNLPTKRDCTCGKTFQPRQRKQLCCSPRCRDEAARVAKKAALPSRPCPVCSENFCGPPKKKFCSAACRDKNNGRPLAAASATPNDDLIAYLISDVIHSGSIGDEIERLKRQHKQAKAALQARLAFELRAPKTIWPKELCGRLALAILLLDHTPSVAFRHPFEKERTFGKKSGFMIRTGRII